MDDLAPRDCLIVKVLRSPHANAMIQSVKTDAAMKGAGDRSRLYLGGRACRAVYHGRADDPEPSPYGKLILTYMCGMWEIRWPLWPGETEDAVDRALKLVKVQYEVLPAILDFRTAKDNEILVHPRTAGDPFVLWRGQ